MKTILKNTTLLTLVLITILGKAQTLNICAGSNTVITAINSLGLVSPSYSMNPGGITSSNATFAVVPASSTNYTLYATGTDSNSAIVTTSNTVLVNVHTVNYSLSSPNAYTLGCGPSSVCAVNILNAQTSPIPGGAVSFTILFPGSSGILPLGFLSPLSSYAINAAGVYTVAVRDNTNLCTNQTTISISQNTVLPTISAIVPQQLLNCTTPSVQLQGNSTTPNVSFLWSFPNIPGSLAGNTIDVYTNTLVPTATLIANYTLTVTDNNNACKSLTVVPMYQNVYTPNAVITSPPNPVCQSSVVLTNQSTTGIPSGTFSTSAAVTGYLWEGPSPQANAAMSSTYLAQTSGVYTLTAMDMNNGCTKTVTYSVTIGSAAAIAHTITGGQAVFNNASTNTTNITSYYWDFGDGNTSTLQNPTHNYLNGGSFLVKHKVSNGLSCTDSVVQSVNISGVPCTANSNFSMIPTGTAQVWNVVPSYPWNVSAASWNWGDGSASNILYTSHQYSAAGIYTICLTVTVSCGATSTTCLTYSIYRVSEQALILQVNVVAPELISGITSFETEEQPAVNIVPNPNAGEFTLNLNTPETEAVHITIRDLSGRIVHNQTFDPYLSYLSINTANLMPGIYLVTIQTAKQKLTKRMVVQH